MIKLAGFIGIIDKFSLLKYISKKFLILIFLVINNVGYTQWVEQINPIGSQLLDIFYLNSNTGYACGNGIIKTTNGGTNWFALTDPLPVTDEYTIHFINENTGFVSNVDFFRTTDGGLNWSTIYSGVDFSDINFINATTGRATGFIGRVYVTYNGGDSWSMEYDGGSDTYESIYFVNANSGWLCGWGGKILRTTNAGGNWIAQSSGTASKLYSIYFSDVNNGVAVGESGTFLKTTNGGTNWEIGNSPTGNNLRKTIFFSTNLGYVTATSGAFFTTNGGTNWLNISPVVSNFYNPLNFVFPSTLNTGAINVYKSTTGGLNLAPVSNLTGTAVSSSQINLSWTDNSQHEDYFFIERSTNGSSWTLIDSVPTNTTNYSSTGLAAYVGYYFRVYPKKSIFYGGVTTTPIVYTLLGTPTLNTPANNTVYSSTGDVVFLFWNPVDNANSYTLDIATDSIFSNIVYTTTELGMIFKQIPNGVHQNSRKYYWRVKCSNSNTQSLYSAHRYYKVQLPDYGNNNATGNNLYYFANSTAGANPSPTKPSFNWRDTTGSVNLIVNQTGLPTYGNIDNGCFVLNNVFGSNQTRLFGQNFNLLDIGTNGLMSYINIDFSFITQPPNTGLPIVTPRSAIFAFWGDLYFQEPSVPSRLCYKLTPNELIVTYSKAILKNIDNNIDTGNYVSFQIVINHLPVNTQNSKIEILYNFDESGSTFKNNYTNNTLRQHLIGLQGLEEEQQIMVYRHFNSSQSLSYAGPIFGSNMALAFAPNNTSLPVELMSFSYGVTGNKVKLDWSTATEINNEGFEIERMNNGGVDWVKVGFVSGSGTVNARRDYSFTDAGLQTGKYRYRLKQKDYNGNFEYFELSGEVVVGVPERFVLSQNYPNPFNPSTKINFELPVSGEVRLVVFDVTGRVISELVNGRLESGYYNYEFSGVGLSSGVYFYRLEAVGFVETKKMVVVR
ncbi:MAG TPA: T9SS type A sorting domain-containing protein [Ignavibacteria bacterium]|nr:T9SS type A sorting domain-containing protein [Ignavibacteria bacterium]